MLLNESILKKLRKETLGHFRFKKLDPETFVITNDSGAFSYLTNDEFQKFVSGGISGQKSEELLSKGFLKIPGQEAEYQKKSARDYARRFSYMGYGPALHIIVVTLRCNHKCQYCHAAVAPMSATDKDMTMETAKKVVDAIFYTTHPTVTIEFQGGEPLVNWGVLKFCIEYAEEKSKRVKKPALFSLVTNLSLMTDEKLRYLLEHKVSINTSLDGTAVVHNFNRIYKDGNSFDLATHWIKKINHLISQNFL